MQVNDREKKPRRLGVWVYIIFLVILIGGAILISSLRPGYTEISYSSFLAEVRDGNILYGNEQGVTISQNEEIPTGRVFYHLKGNNTQYGTNVPDVNEVVKLLSEKGIWFTVDDVPGENIFLTTILPVVLFGLIMFVMLMLMTARLNSSGGISQVSTFTKNRAGQVSAKNNPIRFRDVAGLEEEKEEVVEIVDFLKNPEKYTALGARIPKGLLLVGAPGTGKTLLAKAIAGEAGVPFFTISGSDFVEMFVGVGASRVRELFADAKKNAPCIIFIDEIDAVGRIRGSGLGGGHDEREQTLNQLLVEMDGFTANQGIIVMAATNRADILDPALLRPGRFDRKVAVGKPDVKGREEILMVHSRNKKIGDDVDLRRVAKTTAGFTGADLENLLNEAAIGAAKANRPFITQEDVDRAFVKVGIGQEKKSKVIGDKDKTITAYHEMGHAILFHELPDVGPVHTVSIIPTGLEALGYTMPLPEADAMHYTKSRIRQEIMVAMGGRIAEEITFGDITTGATADIQQATDLARRMVMKYGMSEKIGFLNYEQGEDAVFMGRDLGHLKTYGAETLNEIESEIRRIIAECYDEAKKIILSRQDIMARGAALLLEKEKIGQEEFEALYAAN